MECTCEISDQSDVWKYSFVLACCMLCFGAITW